MAMTTDKFTSEPLVADTQTDEQIRLEAELAAEKQIAEDIMTGLDEGGDAAIFGPYRTAYELALEGDTSKIDELAPELADLAESLRTIADLANQLVEIRKEQ